MMEEIYIGLIARLPRSPSRENIESILDEMAMLREEVVNRLEMQVKAEKTDTNDGQNGRHIQNSNPESIHDLEPRSEKEQDATAEPDKVRPSETLKAFPLNMVLRACPQLVDYAPGGEISHWRELMAAAVTVRSMLGVSPSAYQEACEVMGPENAAVAIACILERAGHINSAGGYLRDLTTRARRGEFSLGPMLMALMRANAGATAKQAG
jgi:replication initiation protein RepC